MLDLSPRLNLNYVCLSNHLLVLFNHTNLPHAHSALFHPPWSPRQTLESFYTNKSCRKWIFYFKNRRDSTHARLTFRIFRSIYWIRGIISVRFEATKSSRKCVQTIQTLCDSRRRILYRFVIWSRLKREWLFSSINSMIMFIAAIYQPVLIDINI